MVLVLSLAGACASTPSYQGTGQDHRWVGRPVAGPETCDLDRVTGAGACVDGEPVRVMWRDGEELFVDTACILGRRNVAVRHGEVVGAIEDCEG